MASFTINRRQYEGEVVLRNKENAEEEYFFPKRLDSKDRWISENVPFMSNREFAVFCLLLISRSWNIGEFEDRIYPYRPDDCPVILGLKVDRRVTVPE